VRKLLAGELPGLRRVETRSLHRGVAGARHGFMEVPPGANKLDMLRQARARAAPAVAPAALGAKILGFRVLGRPVTTGLCMRWQGLMLVAERGAAAGRP